MCVVNPVLTVVIPAATSTQPVEVTIYVKGITVFYIEGAIAYLEEVPRVNRQPVRKLNISTILKTFKFTYSCVSSPIISL